jgi:hypothetical protein
MFFHAWPTSLLYPTRRVLVLGEFFVAWITTKLIAARAIHEKMSGFVGVAPINSARTSGFIRLQANAPYAALHEGKRAARS